MKILITGGAGFLGSHLCDLFLAKGHSVTALDNFITGNKNNIKHLLDKPGFKFVDHDINEPYKFSGPLDAVMHFASPASPFDYAEFPVETLKVGSFGTYNAIELAKSKKAIFMIASTSEIYGDPLINPQPETYWGNVNTVGPRSCYDEAKRFAEAMTYTYRMKYKMQVRILRIFNTYGPRMRAKDGRAVPEFINQALNNEPVTVFGNGKQTRSFCYVSDLVEGIYRLLLSGYNEPVNIGNTHEITLNELAKTIIKITKSRSKIVYKGLPSDDPKLRRPDITKAKTILKWSPSVELNDGLVKTIEYFRKAQRI